MSSTDPRAALVKTLKDLETDAVYSAQSYFEAAKSAVFWSKTIVFVPAVVSAVSGAISALYSAKFGGLIAAISATVAATASFIDSGKASSLKESARKYTSLRHAVHLEIALSATRTADQLEESLNRLSGDRSSIVAGDEPISNRFFKRASARIEAGVTSYESSSPGAAPGAATP